MNARFFDLFTKMIMGLPAQGILKALDLECRMLKEDVESNRFSLPDDAVSIFYFRDFVHAAKLGQWVHHIKTLPADHIEFYKETVVRLVQANELPEHAMDQFDCTFLPDLHG